jgi:hypothetical protein
MLNSFKAIGPDDCSRSIKLKAISFTTVSGHPAHYFNMICPDACAVYWIELIGPRLSHESYRQWRVCRLQRKAVGLNPHL